MIHLISCVLKGRVVLVSHNVFWKGSKIIMGLVVSVSGAKSTICRIIGSLEKRRCILVSYRKAGQSEASSSSLDGPFATNSEWSSDSRTAFHTFAVGPSRPLPREWTRRYPAPLSPRIVSPSENVLRGAGEGGNREGSIGPRVARGDSRCPSVPATKREGGRIKRQRGMPGTVSSLTTYNRAASGASSPAMMSWESANLRTRDPIRFEYKRAPQAVTTQRATKQPEEHQE